MFWVLMASPPNPAIFCPKTCPSQNRRFEKTFPTMRVLEFAQMYSVVLIVLEIADSPVDTD
jgi:hypothetical protein